MVDQADKRSVFERYVTHYVICAMVSHYSRRPILLPHTNSKRGVNHASVQLSRGVTSHCEENNTVGASGVMRPTVMVKMNAFICTGRPLSTQ